MLDNGGLQLMLWPYRNYSTYLGRWLQAEKLGMIPNDNEINPFFPRNQYADGMNYYEAFASNPWSYRDPFGLLWDVLRHRWLVRGGATVVGSPDTVQKLADYIGLETDEFRKWLTLMNDKICTTKGPRTLQQLRPTDDICVGQTVEIPNVVLAYWAGALGGFGKMWVEWGSDINRIEKRGFAAPEFEGLTAGGLEATIRNLQNLKYLHGIFAWGHGDKEGVSFKTVDTGCGATYNSYYMHWRPKYRMALGIIWACHSGDGHAEAQFSRSLGAIFQGAKGILIPLPFHWFGPRTDVIVGPGDQGTNP